MGKLNTAIVTAYDDNYRPLAETVMPNSIEYCAKHGYGLFNYKLEDSEVYSGFQKIEKLLNLLLFGGVDLVWCIDIDVLITNHNIHIEKFIDTKHDFYITKDVNGINAGSFIIKNSDWSRWFLKKILSLQGMFPCEQNAIEHILHKISGAESYCMMLPHPSINSYLYDEYGPNWGMINGGKESKPSHEDGDWRKGDFALHLPGIPLERRIDIFNKIKEEIIYE